MSIAVPAGPMPPPDRGSTRPVVVVVMPGGAVVVVALGVIVDVLDVVDVDVLDVDVLDVDEVDVGVVLDVVDVDVVVLVEVVVVSGAALTFVMETPVWGAPPGNEGDVAVIAKVWKVDPSVGRWITSNVNPMAQEDPAVPTAASVRAPFVGVNE